jgi:hypothetical protein
MNIQKLPSDIVGLSKVMPPLSRRGFMSSSAAFMIRSRVISDGRVMIAPFFKLSFEFQLDARRPECKCRSRC